MPQIVVIGSQSSGKSSVLESIVGFDFLPRGTGIVTRRPLILQLIHKPGKHGKIGGVAAQQKELVEASENIRLREKYKREYSASNGGEHSVDSLSNSLSSTKLSSGQDDGEPEQWAEFIHIRGKKFTDFNEIRREIIKCTDELTKSPTGVSPVPINLRIYSPNVVTLTLVDCPGLTKVPVGDQPDDIEDRIREMLMPYIRSSNAIVLAVTSANTDIANSDGLKLAKDVDPEAKRTIGVLTKVDLMDRGTDIVNILAGKVIPLRLGYVPVINRGQKDIESNKSISSALAYEKEFFESHSAYSARSVYCGVPYLTRKLNSLLMGHIKNFLPEMKAKIQVAIHQNKTELQQLGWNSIDSAQPEPNIILTIITDFCNSFRSIVDGTCDEISSEELYGGARISFIFHEIFASSIRSINPFNNIKDTDIRTILYNTSGSSPAVFVGTQAFEVLVKKQISLLLGPSLKCAKLVYDELMMILNNLLSEEKVFKRFPVLRSKFHVVITNFFKSRLEPTDKLVTDLVNAESCYVNTAHPDFITGQKAMAIVSERLESSKTAFSTSSVNQAIKGPPTQSPSNNMNYQQKNKFPPPQPPRPGESFTSPGQLPPLEQALPDDDANSSLMLKSDNPDSFFGSFFTKKRKPGTVESPPAVLRPPANISERERLETDVIKLLILSYFNIVKRTAADLVPKIIMLNLVSQIKTELQPHLLSEIYRKSEVLSLLKESDVIVSRRQECLNLIKALQEAEEIISEIL